MTSNATFYHIPAFGGLLSSHGWLKPHFLHDADSENTTVDYKLDALVRSGDYFVLQDTYRITKIDK
jgi:hypothetical protein